jgi:hypothetical protein
LRLCGFEIGGGFGFGVNDELGDDIEPVVLAWESTDTNTLLETNHFSPHPAILVSMRYSLPIGISFRKL